MAEDSSAPRSPVCIPVAPFASDVFAKTCLGQEIGDIPDDRKNHSSFSLWVNHKNTFTGITYRDRTLTITEIGRVVREVMAGKSVDFSAQFRTRPLPAPACSRRPAPPAPVPDRTLDCACRNGRCDTAVTICELLDDATGKALSREDARKYAAKHGFAFVDGNDVLEAWDGRARYPRTGECVCPHARPRTRTCSGTRGGPV